METNDTPNPDTPARKRRLLPGEPAVDADQDTAPASPPPPDAGEPAPPADAPAPEPESREAWKLRRAIALGLIRP